MEIKFDGVWAGWRMTTDHPRSSYGHPVLVSPDGQAFGPGDIAGAQRLYQADLARLLGVTRGAINGRINRSNQAAESGRERSFPAEDGVDDQGRPYWYAQTVAHLIPNN